VPSDDALRELIDNERDVDPPCRGPAMREVHHPGVIRPRCGEVPIQQIPRTDPVLGRYRRADALVTRMPDSPSARMARSTEPRDAAGIVVRRISDVIFRRP
jgi:hypothetical protein